VNRARVLTILGLAAALWPVDASAQDEAIRGSWHAREYVLAAGATHEVRGQIHFSQSDWLVLFFVMDGESPVRGSAEGGRYRLAGEELTFEHLHNFSVGEALDGLPGSPLRLETRGGDGPLEPARVRVEDDTLTLFFPSGNRMTFARGSAQ
jgi:hypothetical protein